MTLPRSLFALLCLAPALATAQVRTPEDFLGYALGEAFTPHHRVVDYFEHVAAENPQVVLERYGHTYEGRPLLYVVVSSPKNMAQLEAIRTGNLQRAGLMEGAPSGTAPAIVWLSYNVHGNESVSTEAAMATIHALTDSTRTQVQSWLNDVVVIMDPCVNPDGRDRYVHFFQETRGRFPNYLPEAREHNEPWPGGRTNHYYFDLNRDWAWGTQIETQQRLPHYQRWMPHIHVDFHEQGVNEPYYFAPAAEPYHEAVTPWQRELQEHIGRNHAKYFDAKGWLYFTRQVFDLFYPGYGDTWPLFNGAIGMTYEQGGSGRAGLGIITAEGDTLTLRDRIDHHFTTSLSTIESAAAHRERIVEEFEAFFGDVPAGPYATFVVKGSGDAAKANALWRHLEMQGIAVGRISNARQERGYSYKTGKTEVITITPADLVISMQQPRHVLARVLFEPNAVLNDSLSYDITAWALPYVYGVDAYALPKEVVSDLAWHPGIRIDLQQNPGRPTAYLAGWHSVADAQLLAALLKEGFKVRFSEVPFSINDHTYGRGTLIITRGSNAHFGEAFDETIELLWWTQTHQDLHPVWHSRVSEGVDFGSADVPFLKMPRVAVVGGEHTSAYGLGVLWHFFDQQIEYPVTIVDTDDFADLHLYDFDVIVLPSGSYAQVLTDVVLERVRTWVRDGGRLIAVDGAARFLAGKDGFALKAKDKEGAEEEAEEEKAEGDGDTAPERRLYGERDRHDITESVTGAIFRVDMDTTHPLAFGYKQPYYTLKRNSAAFEMLEDGWNVGILGDDAHVSGFAGSKARESLKQSLLFGVQIIGRGEVVYLMDDPLFRGFWYNGRLLMANAVFMVGQRTISSF